MTVATVTDPVLRTACGSTIPLRLDRWQGEAETTELVVLHDVTGPVIDLGCGPGRHTLALARRGVVVLGVDAAPAAVDVARGRGAPVLHRSVFDPLPGEGRWATALLLDGNIGIGGDPVHLLGRALELLAPGGAALVELEGPGVPVERVRARVERRGSTAPGSRGRASASMRSAGWRRGPGSFRRPPARSAAAGSRLRAA